jgi:hypothetical protein
VTSTAYDFLCGLIIDDYGRRWDDTAEDFQRARVQAILSDAPGVVSQHFVVEPKGSRKTSDAAAIALSLMLTRAPTGARLYGAAADLEQAALMVDSFRELRDRTPGLSGVFVTERKVTYPPKNVEFEALPADSAGAQGLRPYFLDLDELAEWRDTRPVRKFLTNLLAGHDKHHRVDQNARLVVQTNAGSPTSLAGRYYGIARKSRFWAVHELTSTDGATSPLPWVTEEDLEKAREKAETDAEFRRLHLNIWEDGPDRLATLEDVEVCAVLDGDVAPQWGTSYLITADLAYRRDMTAVAVMHTEQAESEWDNGQMRPPRRRIVVDVLRVWRAERGGTIDTMDVENVLAQLSGQYNAPVLLDEAHAQHVVERLRYRGVRAHSRQATQSSNSREVVKLMSLLRDRAIELPADEDLVDEIANVPVVEVAPNMYKLGDERRRGSHHDRTSAIAMGALALEEWALAASESALRKLGPIVRVADASYFAEAQTRQYWEKLAAGGSAHAQKWLRNHPAPDLLYVPARYRTRPDRAR